MRQDEPQAAKITEIDEPPSRSTHSKSDKKITNSKFLLMNMHHDWQDLWLSH